MQEKLIYKDQCSKLTININTKSNLQPTLYETDKKDISSKNIESVVNSYFGRNGIKTKTKTKTKQIQYPQEELKLIIHEIVLENGLWVSQDMNKEVVKISEKIISKKNIEEYSLEYISKQIVEHYKTIYKRKGI